MTVNRQELEKYLNTFLKADAFRDCCPNGLQIQGREEISLVVTGVTASLELIQAAADLGADAIMVHHGLFWRGDPQGIRGMLYHRVAPLIRAGISLFAYHLPLDAHPDLGNNVLLARELEIIQDGWCDDDSPFPMVGLGHLPEEMTLGALVSRTDRILDHHSEFIGSPGTPVRTVAWCTGAASEYLPLAAERGADVFITGEAPERAVHMSRELGVSLITAGHHCTETLGIRALGEHVALQFATQVRFLNFPNNF